MGNGQTTPHKKGERIILTSIPFRQLFIGTSGVDGKQVSIFFYPKSKEGPVSPLVSTITSNLIKRAELNRKIDGVVKLIHSEENEEGVELVVEKVEPLEAIQVLTEEQVVIGLYHTARCLHRFHTINKLSHNCISLGNVFVNTSSSVWLLTEELLCDIKTEEGWKMVCQASTLLDQTYVPPEFLKRSSSTTDSLSPSSTTDSKHGISPVKNDLTSNLKPTDSYDSTNSPFNKNYPIHAIDSYGLAKLIENSSRLHRVSLPQSTKSILKRMTHDDPYQRPQISVLLDDVFFKSNPIVQTVANLMDIKNGVFAPTSPSASVGIGSFSQEIQQIFLSSLPNLLLSLPTKSIMKCITEHLLKYSVVIHPAASQRLLPMLFTVKQKTNAQAYKLSKTSIKLKEATENDLDAFDAENSSESSPSLSNERRNASKDPQGLPSNNTQSAPGILPLEEYNKVIVPFIQDLWTQDRPGLSVALLRNLKRYIQRLDQTFVRDVVVPKVAKLNLLLEPDLPSLFFLAVPTLIKYLIKKNIDISPIVRHVIETSSLFTNDDQTRTKSLTCLFVHQKIPALLLKEYIEKASSDPSPMVKTQVIQSIRKYAITFSPQVTIGPDTTILKSFLNSKSLVSGIIQPVSMFLIDQDKNVRLNARKTIRRLMLLLEQREHAIEFELRKASELQQKQRDLALRNSSGNSTYSENKNGVPSRLQQNQGSENVQDLNPTPRKDNSTSIASPEDITKISDGFKQLSSNHHHQDHLSNLQMKSQNPQHNGASWDSWDDWEDQDEQDNEDDEDYNQNDFDNNNSVKEKRKPQFEVRVSSLPNHSGETNNKSSDGNHVENGWSDDEDFGDSGSHKITAALANPTPSNDEDVELDLKYRTPVSKQLTLTRTQHQTDGSRANENVVGDLNFDYSQPMSPFTPKTSKSYDGLIGTDEDEAEFGDGWGDFD